MQALKNSNGILHRKKNPKICMELQETLNSQGKLEKKDKAIGIIFLISNCIKKL